MKKIKILTSLTALATLGTTIGVLSSCAKKEDSTIITVDLKVGSVPTGWTIKKLPSKITSEWKSFPFDFVPSEGTDLTGHFEVVKDGKVLGATREGRNFVNTHSHSINVPIRNWTGVKDGDELTVNFVDDGTVEKTATITKYDMQEAEFVVDMTSSTTSITPTSSVVKIVSKTAFGKDISGKCLLQHTVESEVKVIQSYPITFTQGETSSSFTISSSDWSNINDNDSLTVVFKKDTEVKTANVEYDSEGSFKDAGITILGASTSQITSQDLNISILYKTAQAVDGTLVVANAGKKLLETTKVYTFNDSEGGKKANILTIDATTWSKINNNDTIQISFKEQAKKPQVTKITSVSFLGNPKTTDAAYIGEKFTSSKLTVMGLTTDSPSNPVKLSITNQFTVWDATEKTEYTKSIVDGTLDIFKNEGNITFVIKPVTTETGVGSVQLNIAVAAEPVVPTKAVTINYNALKTNFTIAAGQTESITYTEGESSEINFTVSASEQLKTIIKGTFAVYSSTTKIISTSKEYEFQPGSGSSYDVSFEITPELWTKITTDTVEIKFEQTKVTATVTPDKTAFEEAGIALTSYDSQTIDATSLTLTFKLSKNPTTWKQFEFNFVTDETTVPMEGVVKVDSSSTTVEAIFPEEVFSKIPSGTKFTLEPTYLYKEAKVDVDTTFTDAFNATSTPDIVQEGSDYTITKLTAKKAINGTIYLKNKDGDELGSTTITLPQGEQQASVALTISAEKWILINYEEELVLSYEETQLKDMTVVSEHNIELGAEAGEYTLEVKDGETPITVKSLTFDVEDVVQLTFKSTGVYGINLLTDKPATAKLTITADGYKDAEWYFCIGSFDAVDITSGVVKVKEGFTGSTINIPNNYFDATTNGLVDVTEIAQDGFVDAAETLAAVTLPNKLIDIGSGAFQGCTKLEGNLVIPASVTHIGPSALFNVGLEGVSFENDIGWHQGDESYVGVDNPITNKDNFNNNSTEPGATGNWGATGLNRKDVTAAEYTLTYGTSNPRYSVWESATAQKAIELTQGNIYKITINVLSNHPIEYFNILSSGTGQPFNLISAYSVDGSESTTLESWTYYEQSSSPNLGWIFGEVSGSYYIYKPITIIFEAKTTQTIYFNAES